MRKRIFFLSLFVLFLNSPLGLCSEKYFTVEAQDVDYKNDELKLYNEVQFVLQNGEEIYCREAKFYPKTLKLFLSKNVICKNSTKIDFESDYVDIFLKKEGDKYLLQKTICRGNTKIDYLSKENRSSHTITCNETVYIDHEKLQVFMSSASAAGTDDAQICFQDDRGTIYTNSCDLFYEMNGKEARLKSLIARGDVHILNDKKGATKQYALADKAEFWPDTDKVILTASKDKSVLFYDESNDSKVTAPQMQITRCQTSGKEIIESSGIVHCEIPKDRLNKLKSRFTK